MATPPPTVLTPEQRLAIEQEKRYERMKRNVAIAGVIVCPIIALMPPRKLDLYTFSLGMGFYFSADHLSYEYNGRMLLANLTFRPAFDLPTQTAKDNSKILKERAEMDRIRREGMVEGGEQEDRRGILQKLWMGDEKEGWKEKRMEEERKALAEGKGYSGIILDQIWDVWNWDKRKRGAGEERVKEQPNDEKKDGQ